MIDIIPAIDIIDGKCVRLTQGDFHQLTEYNLDPLAVAHSYEEAGFKLLHMVDLDGAKLKRIINWQALKYVCEQTKLTVDFGGGIQSNKDARTAFECGADQIVVGSIAVRNKVVVRSWMEMFGAERLILGADVRDRKIAISGWNEQTDVELVPFVTGYYKFGIRTVICTDIAQDGLLHGPNFDLYKELKDIFTDMRIIASGGVSCVEDVRKLNEMGIDGVIIGKALYDGKIQLAELQEFL